MLEYWATLGGVTFHVPPSRGCWLQSESPVMARWQSRNDRIETKNLGRARSCQSFASWCHWTRMIYDSVGCLVNCVRPFAMTVFGPGGGANAEMCGAKWLPFRHDTLRVIRILLHSASLRDAECLRCRLWMAEFCSDCCHFLKYATHKLRKLQRAFSDV